MKKSYGPEDHERAARLLFEGYRTSQVAWEIGVHRGTIWRWSKTEAFQQAYEQALTSYKSICLDAYLERQEALLQDSNPFIARKAAAGIIKRLEKYIFGG